MLKARRSILRSAIAVLAILAAGLPISAQAQGPSGTGPVDARDVQAFVDPIITDQMAKAHIPGLVFVVVKDGKILYEKGYGEADLGRHTPMTPDRTLLQVYSVSKVFTATAIMQLAEQGRINLNEDVNRYLKAFQIHDPFPQPVTVANLLTHTGGFDSDTLYLATAVQSESEVPSLSSYLASHPPRVLWPPGQQYVYGNEPYTVLGQVVEDVSGRPFAQYVEESILKPPAMSHASFLQPSSQTGDAAVTYKYVDGAQLQVPVSYFGNTPARGLTATGEDMAHFMIAQLERGEYRGTRILQAATVQEMHAPHFTYQPGEPGMAYGFQELFWPAGGVWKDGGGPNSPTSYMSLLPEQRLGFFFSYNSDDQFELASELSNRFLFHYFPYQGAGPQPAPGSTDDLARFTGVYRAIDYAHLTVAKLVTLLNGDYPQVIQSDGSLAIRWSGNQDQPTPLVQTTPFIFTGSYADAGNLPYHVVFRQGPGQEIGQMSIGLDAYEKVRWFETATVQEGLMAFFALAFLVAPIVGFLSLLRRGRGREDRETRRPAADRPVLILPILIGLLNLTFLLLLAWTLLNAFDPRLGLQYGPPTWFLAILTIPILTTMLTLALVPLAALSWRTRGSNTGRILVSLFTLVALGFVPFLMYWNLLGYHY